MSDPTIVGLALLALLIMVLCSVHIAVALLLTSIVAMTLLTGFDVALSLLATTTFNAIHSYLFAVVPLFILMGAFMARSQAAAYLYLFLFHTFKWVRGGLGVATVFSNAVFAAVTGASVASAAVFSRVALPEMKRHGYSQRLALGAVAGSSILGMLIPPSLLLILYGILTQVSIGALFIGGVIPGLVLAAMYSIMIVVMGYLRPSEVGHKAPHRPRQVDERGEVRLDRPSMTGADIPMEKRSAAEVTEPAPLRSMSVARSLAGSIPILALVALVLGGIWTGLFSPIEASAVGALGAFVIGKFMGMTWRGTIAAFQDTVLTTGAVMILLVAALLYSRMLATSGLIQAAGDFIVSRGMGPMMFTFVVVLVILLMGAILDSASILLLTVPVVHATVLTLGLDELWFGIVLVVAVEAGLLTPPFGMVPFTMAAVLGDDVRVEDIFKGAVPFLLVMLVMIALLFAFPALATWLPSIMQG